MFLIKNILDSLDDLAYPDKTNLENKLQNLNLVNFSIIISWITKQLSKVYPIESIVNFIKTENDFDSFKIELSSLLKELNSPYDVNNLDKNENKLIILNYLCGELYASNLLMIKNNKNQKKIYFESEIAKYLRLILEELDLDLLNDEISLDQLFEKILFQLDNYIKKNKIDIEESVLYKNVKSFNQKSWLKLEEINQKFKEDYELRRKTFITRCNCTVSSFKWNKNFDKEKEIKIDTLYNQLSYILNQSTNIKLAKLLTLTHSECHLLNDSVISKTHQKCDIIPPQNKSEANQGLQQRISLHKYLIGDVPDRGGRLNETTKPTNETFQQQQRQYQHKSNQQNYRSNVQTNDFNTNRIQGAEWNQSNYQTKPRNFQKGNNYSVNNRFQSNQEKSYKDNNLNHYNNRTFRGQHGWNNDNFDNANSRNAKKY